MIYFPQIAFCFLKYKQNLAIQLYKILTSCDNVLGLHSSHIFFYDTNYDIQQRNSDKIIKIIYCVNFNSYKYYLDLLYLENVLLYLPYFI